MKILIRVLQAILLFFVLIFATIGDVFFCVVQIAFILFSEWALRRAQGRTKSQQKERQVRENLVNENKIPAYSEDVKHISGLNLAQEASCRVSVFADEIVVEAVATKFRIPQDRVQGAELVDSTERHVVNKGSLGRAIVWDFLAGPAVGAVAGISGKSKTVNLHRYFTCIYFEDKSGEDSCLVFENGSAFQYVVTVRGEQPRKTSLCDEVRRFARGGHRDVTL